MTQPVTLVVSIDTEEDNWQPARTGITTDNVRELPRLHGVLEGLGVRPTYFVTYQVACQEWAAAILRDIRATGTAEIGAHLHPWNTPPLDEAFMPRNTMLSNLPQAVQRAKLECATAMLERSMGERPRSFRAGRWGFGQSTAAALLACGYCVDSSVTPFQSWEREHGPSHVGAPLDVYRLDGRGDPRVPVADGALVEVPVSAGYSRGPVRSWARVSAILDQPVARRLRLTAVASRLGLMRHITLSPEFESAEDMLVLSRRLIAQGVRCLHMTWHSPSLAPGLSPFSATARDVERLYARLATYVEGLAALAPLRLATVGEAAVQGTAEPAAVPTPPERRLVVVSYHHPPDGAIGGMRWAGLTKYLGPLGWKSWIITAAPQAATRNGASPVVVSCPRRETLNDWWRRLRNSGGTKRPSGNGGAQPTPAKQGNRILARLRLELAMLLALPDQSRGWMLRAAVRARRLIREVRPDVVVSSGPPHSAHLVAWLATRGTGVRWIADFRDPWAGPPMEGWRSHPYYRSRIARTLAILSERLVLSSASAVLANTREFVEALRELHPGVAVQWLSNGTDAELLPQAGPQLSGMGLVHVGTLYGNRDLGPVLRGLRTLLDRHPHLVAEGPALRTAGPFDESSTRAALLDQVAALGLTGQVAELGVLDRAAALRLSAQARLALVLAQGQELQVPAKLYELVAMGVPTLVVAPSGSAASSEARRIGAIAVDPADGAGLVEAVERACLGPRSVRSLQPNTAVDYRYLASRLTSMLASVASDGASS